MSSLTYRGKTPAAAKDLISRLYLDSALGGASVASRSYVTQKVSDTVALKASTAYVDAQDATFTTKSYVDTQDALSIPTGQKAAANGVAALDGTGKVPSSALPVLGTGIVKGPYQPTNRFTASVGATTRAKLFEFSYAAPGFWWRPLVFASVLAYSDGSSRGDVEVRVGSLATDTICAAGRAINFSAADWGTTAVVPASSATGLSGMPVTGYNQTAAVVITGWLYNPWAAGTAQVTDVNFVNACLFLVKITDV